MTNSTYQNSPILICGMHRSGTSLFAQALSICGLYLGEEEDLLQSTPQENPAGFWEYEDIIQFADKLLDKLGGSWDDTSPFNNSSWLEEIDLSKEQKKANKILNPLVNSGKRWGWKDPRATVMLPFWRSIFPEMQVMICLRNPIEVAFSLSKRERTHVDYEQGLELWLKYYDILNRDINDTKFIVTHYKAMVFEPQKELQRVCGFFGFEPTEEMLQKAIESIDSDFYRGVVPEDMLTDDHNLPEGLIETYQKLTNQAGDNFKSVKDSLSKRKDTYKAALNKTLSTATDYFDQYNQTLETVKSNLNEQKAKLDKTTNQIQNQKEAIDQYISQLADNKEKLKEHNERTNELKTAIQEKNQQITDSKNKLNEHNKRMNEFKTAIQEKNQQLTENRQTIKEQIGQLVESRKKLKDRNDKLSESKKQLKEQNKQLTISRKRLEEQNKQLTASREKLEEQDKQILDLSQSIQSLQKQKQQRLTKIRREERQIQNLTQQVQSMKQTMETMNMQITQLNQEVLFYANSKSWRLTRPLRKMMNLLRGKRNA